VAKSKTPLVMFDEKWKVLESQMIREIDKLIAKGLTPHEATTKAMIKYEFGDKLEKMVLGVALAKVSSTYIIKDKKKLERFFLNKHWPDTKYTLAQSIAPNNYKQVIVSTIQEQLKANKAYASIAKQITQRTPVSGTLPKYLDDLVRQARKGEVLLGPLKKATAQVSRLTTEGAAGPRLKKAYTNLLKVVQDGNSEAITKAVTRSVAAKARQNAVRIAVTESSRAQASIFMTRIRQDDDVVGFQRNLSPSHPRVDVCDFYQQADMYGMGAGISPKGAPLNFPIHPFDKCTFTPVFRSQIKNPTFKIKNGVKFLKDNPKKAKQMMTRKGYKNFLKKPASWQSNIQSYNSQKLQTPEIPQSAIKKR